MLAFLKLLAKQTSSELAPQRNMASSLWLFTSSESPNSTASNKQRTIFAQTSPYQGLNKGGGPGFSHPLPDILGRGGGRGGYMMFSMMFSVSARHLVGGRSASLL